MQPIVTLTTVIITTDLCSAISSCFNVVLFLLRLTFRLSIYPNRMTELAAENWKRRIKMDILAIAVALALQDGPFFCLRMTLIFRQVSPVMQLISQYSAIRLMDHRIMVQFG